jgi:hypothetical protein
MARPPGCAAVAAEGQELSLALLPRLGPLLAGRIAGWGELALADLSYANLWLFRRAHGYRFHEGDWPCISGHSYDGRPHAIPLFPLAQAPLPALREMAQRHGSLFPLAEHEALALQAQGFVLSANPEDADYLYRAAQMRDYPGRLLRKKRALVAQLQQAHCLAVQPYSPALEADALAVLAQWLADKGKATGEADDLPTREALARAPELGLHGFVHCADGEPAGLVLAEELQAGVWVMRFAKSLARFKGMAPHMFQHFAAHAPRPALWLNFEQDLGLPNFRRSKQSYQPERLLAKWRASHLPQDRAPARA